MKRPSTGSLKPAAISLFICRSVCKPSDSFLKAVLGTGNDGLFKVSFDVINSTTLLASYLLD